MLMNLVKIKYKTKKQKELHQKLRIIKDDLKEAILKKYLEKCKVQNALKFFDWRSRVHNKHLDKQGQLLMSIRISNLNRHETVLFKDTEEVVKLEQKKAGEIQTLDTSLEPVKDESAMRGSVNNAKRF